jgi:FdhD protein
VSRPGPRTKTTVTVAEAGTARQKPDTVATEEPLELRLDMGGQPERLPERLAVTMRTPGADFELAAGLCYAEGVVAGLDELAGIGYCTNPGFDPAERYNVVTVALAGQPGIDLDKLDRRGTMTSACGVCGKTSLEALSLAGYTTVPPGPSVAPEAVTALPDRLRQAQRVFAATGGLHAAGLFDPDGRLLAAREDVGRHNAVDKVLGWALLNGRMPLAGRVLMVSGRTSYEIVQKAVAAQVAVVCAVSAPSSLAVELARRFGLTLVGFVRGERFNVYAGAERISGADQRERSPQAANDCNLGRKTG